MRDVAGKKKTILLSAYFLCCALTMLLYHQKNHGFMNDFPIGDYWDAVLGVVGVKG